ncbi:hypothetical protein B4915_05700 [Leucobacter massiliensis]|uniref:Uncharacterized protein n=1 Tax=Leucobacter massiliensis TaxID=1686285 RepID=A0A2S9QPU3_9MICO|nr:hypothetical protein B4915_05700 [Leucobacter massiliensis]
MRRAVRGEARVVLALGSPLCRRIVGFGIAAGRCRTAHPSRATALRAGAIPRDEPGIPIPSTFPARGALARRPPLSRHAAAPPSGS